MSHNNDISRKTVKTSAEEPLSFGAALEQFLGRLPARSRDIVMARFGIDDGRPKTLEEIGRIYQITRERVRQVIASALGFLAGLHEHPTLLKISERIQSTLEEKNGIIKTDKLLDILAPMGGKERGALLTFIECFPVIKHEKATEECEETYRLKDFSFVEWKKVKDTAKTILEETNQALEGEELFVRFQKKNSTVNKQELFDFLIVSKDVCQNVFGKWGLSNWSDIKPRGTREKAHLVLKTKGIPLHFRQIASLIDSYGLKNRKKSESHPQTVHNELIKDKRFVLIGRGIYALSEWGYKKGTVKEVLEEILRKASQPLSREEVLAQVLKVRQVKKSTVIINLNAFFSRVGKNAYSFKK